MKTQVRAKVFLSRHAMDLAKLQEKNLRQCRCCHVSWCL